SAVRLISTWAACAGLNEPPRRPICMRGEATGNRAAFSASVRVFDGRPSIDSRSASLAAARPRPIAALFSAFLPLILRLALGGAALAFSVLACFASLAGFAGLESLAGFFVLADFATFAGFLAEAFAAIRFVALDFLFDGFSAFAVLVFVGLVFVGLAFLALLFCFGFCLGTFSSRNRWVTAP